MPIPFRAGTVVQTIARDPVRFAGHLVRAARQGLPSASLGNLGTHLRAGLVSGWLTGALGGLGIPAPCAVGRAGRALGGAAGAGRHVAELPQAGAAPRRADGGRAGTTFELVTTLVRGRARRRRGGRSWSASGTCRRRCSGACGSVSRTVVGRAVMRLALLLNPAGAVIQALLTTYESVMFFREAPADPSGWWSRSSTRSGASRRATWARGGLRRATMARTVPLVIAFLARLSASAASPSASATSSAASESPSTEFSTAPSNGSSHSQEAGKESLLQIGLPRDQNERLRSGMEAALEGIRRPPGTHNRKVLLIPVLGLVKAGTDSVSPSNPSSRKGTGGSEATSIRDRIRTAAKGRARRRRERRPPARSSKTSTSATSSLPLSRRLRRSGSTNQRDRSSTFKTSPCEQNTGQTSIYRSYSQLGADGAAPTRASPEGRLRNGRRRSGCLRIRSRYRWSRLGGLVGAGRIKRPQRRGSTSRHETGEIRGVLFDADVSVRAAARSLRSVVATRTPTPR